jgi:hypothetical protein
MEVRFGVKQYAWMEHPSNSRGRLSYIAPIDSMS